MARVPHFKFNRECNEIVIPATRYTAQIHLWINRKSAGFAAHKYRGDKLIGSRIYFMSWRPIQILDHAPTRFHSSVYSSEGV